MKWKLLFAYTWPFWAVPLATILLLAGVGSLYKLFEGWSTAMLFASAIFALILLIFLTMIKDWAVSTIRTSRPNKSRQPNPLRRSDTRLGARK